MWWYGLSRENTVKVQGQPSYGARWGGGRSRKEERTEGKKRAEARARPILNTADRERVWAVLVACFLSNVPSCPHRPCAASRQVPESSNETPFVKGVTFLEGGI